MHLSLRGSDYISQSAKALIPASRKVTSSNPVQSLNVVFVFFFVFFLPPNLFVKLFEELKPNHQSEGIRVEESGLGPWLGLCDVFFGKIRYSHSTSLHQGIKMGSSNWCENLTKWWGRGRGGEPCD